MHSSFYLLIHSTTCLLICPLTYPPPIHPFIYPRSIIHPLSLSFHKSTDWYISPSFGPSIPPLIHLNTFSLYTSLVHPPTYALSIHLLVSPFVDLSINLFIYPSVHLTIPQSVDWSIHSLVHSSLCSKHVCNINSVLNVSLSIKTERKQNRYEIWVGHSRLWKPFCLISSHLEDQHSWS